MSTGKPYIRTEDHEKLVTAMCIAGIHKGDMARVLGISDDTLWKHYRHELETAENQAVANVAARLYREAINGNLGAMIFYLKTRGRWRETDRLEITGAGGGAITMKRARELTDEELLQIITAQREQGAIEAEKIEKVEEKDDLDRG